MAVALLAGCDQPAVSKPPRASAAPKPQGTRASRPVAETTAFPVGEEAPPTAPARSRPQPKAPLADLVSQAAAEEFELPAIDDARLAPAGIRKIAGRHITIYTDLPKGEVDELPAVFDAAVPLWIAYFDVKAPEAKDWKIFGHVIKDQERFAGTGLFPASLPDFPNGFSQGSQLWLYDQPSAYYRRHLLLHEGTHCFMYRWLGGAGPPWYMEGMAELLGTHRWADGKLTLAVMPERKEDVPYWGRVKIVRDEYAANRGLMLEEVLRYDNRAHLRNEPYGWCWAAAAFFDGHPLTQKAFRELQADTRDRSIDFSRRFQERLADRWREISEDWQVFVVDCDYGYDFARAAIVRKAAGPLPAGGATFELAADRGWQSTGYQLEAGKKYMITAGGRYQVAGGEKPWPSEAGGVTIRYHNGQPLGMLIGAVCDESQPLAAQLSSKRTIGLSTVLAPAEAGVLYLSINEASSALADNKGELTVEIQSN
jgi:hypothetical protein